MSAPGASYYYLYLPDGTQIGTGVAGQNPTIYCISGMTIMFDLYSISGHPFMIRTASGSGNEYNTGLVHFDGSSTYVTGSNAQGKESGYLFWTPPHGASGTYKYQCQYHGGMIGDIVVKDITAI